MIPTEAVVSASLASVGSDLYITALTDTGLVLLAYGDPEAGLELLEIPVQRDDVPVTPNGVAVYADDDRLVIAVAAGGDDDDPLHHGVGWAFFGL